VPLRHRRIRQILIFPILFPILLLSLSHIHPGPPSHQSTNTHPAMAHFKHLPTSDSSLAVFGTEHQSFGWTTLFWQWHRTALPRTKGKAAAFDPLVPHLLLLLDGHRAPLGTATRMADPSQAPDGPYSWTSASAPAEGGGREEGRTPSLPPGMSIHGRNGTNFSPAATPFSPSPLTPSPSPTPAQSCCALHVPPLSRAEHTEKSVYFPTLANNT